jgi:hypothetical protein
MNTIITKVRYLIDDSTSSVTDIFTYSTSSTFTLTESNPLSVTTVYRNDVITTNYTFNTVTGKVTILDSMTSGDTIQIDYSCYENYSDNEIIGFVNASFVYISNYNYADFNVESGNEIYPVPTSREEKLIALIASMLINPNIKRLALPDITITMPKDDTMSIEDAISNTIASFKRGSDGVGGNHGVFEVID